MKKTILLSGLAIIMLLGCAKRPESIASSHVSHEKYANLQCTELNEKITNARTELSNFAQMQTDKADQDDLAVLILGIPFSSFSGDYEEEVAKWKGEIEAIEKVQVAKKCVQES